MVNYGISKDALQVNLTVDCSEFYQGQRSEKIGW